MHDEIARAYQLLAEGADRDREHRLWQMERAEREFLDPPPAPPPPAPTTPWMKPDERARVERSVAKSIARNREMQKRNGARRESFDNMATAIGEALGRERVAMRAHVAGAVKEANETCTRLEARIRELENQRLADARDQIKVLSALHTEIIGLRSELAAAKSARGAPVLDLVPNPNRGAA
jgi:hypothetical protein